MKIVLARNIEIHANYQNFHLPFNRASWQENALAQHEILLAPDHQALKYLRGQCVKQGINWIVDADIRGFFDNIDHDHLQTIVSQRVNDGALKRLIGKWLKAGVLENAEIINPSKGTPQGGVRGCS